MAKGAYIGVGGAIYREVEYIESSGTQYIDTGFKPNQNTRVVMDFHNSGDYSSLSSGVAVLFGVRKSTSDTAFCLWIGTKTYPQYGSVAYNANGNFTTNINSRLVYDFNKNVVSIGGSTITCTSKTFTCSYNIYLLTLNQAGTAQARYVSGKLYSCKIYDNSTLIRDYVPVINQDGTAGLFDKVNRKYYTNSGTGTFVAGAETGSTYTADGKARKIKKAYIGIENFKQRDLPTGYTQLEYIQSTGTQYIDTGFKPNQDTKVVMDVASTTASTDHVLFSARTSASSKAFEIIWSSSNSYYRFYYNNGYTNLSETSVLPTIRRHLVFDRNLLIVDGYIANRNYAAFQTECNLVLLARNTVGTISAYAKAKLYSCQVYDDGNLIRDYVPCKNSSGTIGLYDIVNSVFYANAGTGTFTAGTSAYSSVARKIAKAYIGIGGSEVYREVEYLESSGTQYINTGIKPNQDTRVIAKIKCPTGTATNHILGGRQSSTSNAYGLFASANNCYAFSYNTKQNDFSTAANTSEPFILDIDKNTASINDVSVTGTFAKFDSPVDMVLFGVNTNGTITRGTSTIYSCKIYDYGTLVRDYVPVINSSGTVGLFDKVEHKFYANAGSGTFAAGAETGETHTSYGVARLCWTPIKTVSLYGDVASLSTNKIVSASESIGNYVIFAGGTCYGGSTVGYSGTVDVYDTKLTKVSISTGVQAADSIASATNKNYAIFACGDGTKYGDQGHLNNVNAYDASLTLTNATASQYKRTYARGVSVGDYVLIAGGYANTKTSGTSNYQYINLVEAYDNSLTKSTPTALSSATTLGWCGSVGNYGLIGRTGGVTDVYDTSLVRTTIDGLGANRAPGGVANAGDFLVLAGGSNSSNGYVTATVDTFDASLTKGTATGLSAARTQIASASVKSEGMALFIGGYVYNSGNSYDSEVVNAYDDSLVRTTPTKSKYTIKGRKGGSVGNYALAVGGGNTYYSDTVYKYAEAWSVT